MIIFLTSNYPTLTGVRQVGMMWENYKAVRKHLYNYLFSDTTIKFKY